MSNHNELRKFMECLAEKEELSNGDLRFTAIVTCSWKKKRFQNTITSVTVQRAGFQQGTISIEPTDEFDVDEFHTEFNPDFQTYTFDDDNQMLIIEGKSTKMGGNYKVTITES